MRESLSWSWRRRRRDKRDRMDCLFFSFRHKKHMKLHQQTTRGRTGSTDAGKGRNKKEGSEGEIAGNKKRLGAKASSDEVRYKTVRLSFSFLVCILGCSSSSLLQENEEEEERLLHLFLYYIVFWMFFHSFSSCTSTCRSFLILWRFLFIWENETGHQHDFQLDPSTDLCDHLLYCQTLFQ